MTRDELAAQLARLDSEGWTLFVKCGDGPPTQVSLTAEAFLAALRPQTDDGQVTLHWRKPENGNPLRTGKATVTA